MISLIVLLACLPSIGRAEGVPCSSEPTDMTISYGALVNCSVYAPGADPTDTFRVNTSAGDKVVVVVGYLYGTSGTPCVEVFSPLSGSVGKQCNLAGARVEFTSSQGGTYTMIVNELGDNSFMDYAIAVERISPPSPSAFPIIFSQTTGSDLNGPGDPETWTPGRSTQCREKPLKS